MTAEDWSRLKHWFGEALAAGADGRAAVVARARREDPGLAGELASLLASDAGPGPATVELAPQPAAWRERFPEGVPAGMAIGRYRVKRELGRGGTGLVVAAERADDEFHRPVAIKLLRFRGAEQGKANPLDWERGSLARLQHGNVASLLDWGTTPDGIDWLATEFVFGEPIDVHCRERGLDADAVLALFAQVGAAVAYAHSRGVIHLDLKPGNILVSPEGTVKLLDFGIAQLAGLEPAAGGAQRFTPLYASPEQRRGGAATAASDVYSLGVVLARLLTGAPGLDLTGLPPRLAAILRHALVEQPERRYGGVPALLEDLDRYRRRLPPRGFAAPWRQRAALFLLRQQRPLWSVAGTAAAAAGLVAGAGWWAHRPRPLPLPHRPVPALVFAPPPLHGALQVLPLRVAWPGGARVRSVEVVTRGVPDLDFRARDQTACTGVFAPGSGCELHIEFAPTAPGWRLGAVLFRDAAGRVVSTEYLAGLGPAPAQGEWAPPARPLRVYTGLRLARGLSLDGEGNAYFEDTATQSVYEIPAALSALRVVARMTLLGGATAVDGAGNLYFSSLQAGAIFEMGPAGPFRIARVPPSVSLDNNLAVDGAGNLYCSGQGGGVYVVASGSHRVTRLIAPSPAHRFVGLASDALGNLFLADMYSDALYEIPAGSRELVLLVSRDGRLDRPHTIAALSDGGLLVGNDVPGARLLRYSRPGFGSAVLAAAGNQSVAVGGQDRLYAVVDNRTVAVYRLQPRVKRARAGQTPAR